MTKKKSDGMPLLDTLNDGWKDGEELKISHLDSKVLSAIQDSFLVLLIQAAGFYIRRPTKSTAFHARAFIGSANRCCAIRTIHTASLTNW